MQPRNLIFDFVAEWVDQLLKLSGLDVDARLEFRQTVTDMMHQQLTTQHLASSTSNSAKNKGSPYSTPERRVLELISVLGSQPAGNVSHRLPVDCHYFLPGLQLLSQPLRGLLPISLLGLETLLNAYKTMSHAEGVYWIACHMHLSDQTSAKFQLIVSNCDKVMLY